jgi:hypothetical protein
MGLITYKYWELEVMRTTAHTYRHTHIHIYTYIHTYIHTHIHIYTHLTVLPRPQYCESEVMSMGLI